MEPDDRFVGKSIPTSEFTQDDGSADPVVIAALQQYRAGTLPAAAAINAVAASRLFVPVKAVLDSLDETEDGHQVEKDSHMATVSLQTADGRRALLAFTSTAAMSAWDPQARPVVAHTAQVAAAAVDEGADGLIVDLQSPHSLVIDGPALAAVAAGESLPSPLTDPEITAAISEVVGPIGAAAGCQFELTEPMQGADVRLTLLAAEDTDVVGILQQAGALLAENEVLRSKLPGGIELSARPAD